MQTRIATARDESVPLRLVTACNTMLAPVRVVHWTLVSLCNANLASRRDEGVVIRRARYVQCGVQTVQNKTSAHLRSSYDALIRECDWN